MPIKKRRPSTSEWVYTENGQLVVRTPAACTKWPHEFRIRVIRDYVPPDTEFNLSTFSQKYMTEGRQDEEYLVQGQRLLVRQPHMVNKKAHSVLVKGTEIVNVGTKKAMLLSHPEPAIRMLIIYSFLIGELIGGVPKHYLYDAENI